jgi:hypothetical protein
VRSPREREREREIIKQPETAKAGMKTKMDEDG